MGALQTWRLGGQEDCRRCCWGTASHQWRSSLQRTLHTHLCTQSRGDRGQESETFHRGQSHMPGRHGDQLGEPRILDLDLDYYQYWGFLIDRIIPMRILILFENSCSNSGPHNIPKVSLRRESQSLSRDSPLCEAVILTIFHDFLVKQWFSLPSTTSRSINPPPSFHSGMLS